MSGGKVEGGRVGGRNKEEEEEGGGRQHLPALLRHWTEGGVTGAY